MSLGIETLREMQCPLCHGLTKTAPFSQGGKHFTEFRCDLCREFAVEKQCLLALAKKNERDPILSGVARAMAGQGERLLLTNDSIDEARKLAPTTIVAKGKHLLRVLARMATHPGFDVRIDPPRDFPLVYGLNAQELDFFLEHLKELGWVVTLKSARYVTCTITAKGLIELENDKAANVDSTKAFVAMWFDPAMNSAYEAGFRAAIEADSGFRSVRIDRLEHADKIDDRIIAEIRESRFLVADFTGQRCGVYFEAGFAKGLGLPVIWTCREDYVSNLHFDTRQYNHILWKEPTDLREKLSLRIRATIGKGPVALQ